MEHPAKIIVLDEGIFEISFKISFKILFECAAFETQSSLNERFKPTVWSLDWREMLECRALECFNCLTNESDVEKEIIKHAAIFPQLEIVIEIVAVFIVYQRLLLKQF